MFDWSCVYPCINSIKSENKCFEVLLPERRIKNAPFSMLPRWGYCCESEVLFSVIHFSRVSTLWLAWTNWNKFGSLTWNHWNLNGPIEICFVMNFVFYGLRKWLNALGKNKFESSYVPNKLTSCEALNKLATSDTQRESKTVMWGHIQFHSRGVTYSGHNNLDY